MTISCSTCMKFWGVEVKGKQPCHVSLDEGSVVHVSQATLGDINGKESVTIYVRVDDKKLVLGRLAQDKPELFFDLIFNSDIEIYLNRENESVHLMGYQIDPTKSLYYDICCPLCVFSVSSDGHEYEYYPPMPEKNKRPFAVAEPKAKNKSKPKKKDGGDEDKSNEDYRYKSSEINNFEIEGYIDEADADADGGNKRPSNVVKTPQSKKLKIATCPKSDSENSVQNTPVVDKTPEADDSILSRCSYKKTFISDVALQSHPKAKPDATGE